MLSAIGVEVDVSHSFEYCSIIGIYTTIGMDDIHEISVSDI